MNLTHTHTVWSGTKCLSCRSPRVQANNNTRAQRGLNQRNRRREKFTHRSFSFCRLDLCSSPIRMTAARIPAFLEFTLDSVSDILPGPQSGLSVPVKQTLDQDCPALFRHNQALCHWMWDCEYTSPSVSLLLVPSLSLSLSLPSPALIACPGLDLIGGINNWPRPQPLLLSYSLSPILQNFHLFCSWTACLSCQTFPLDNKTHTRCL